MAKKYNTKNKTKKPFAKLPKRPSPRMKAGPKSRRN